jgi:predicted naringenin-chalcone synthase
MLDAYQPEGDDRRKIALLYERCGIDARYSVMPDYSVSLHERKFYAETMDMEPFPSLEKRMDWYGAHAPSLSVDAIRQCMEGHADNSELTWLITVSCTGMSAPGLDINIMQELQLSPDLQRSSINFMGCYAAVHALKLADAICRSNQKAKVLIVCTELCTLHFQKGNEMDNIASSLLFGDGAAAVLVTGDAYEGKGLHIKGFHSQVALQGQQDMAWHLSGQGFLMRLSAYIPQLIKDGISPLLKKALENSGLAKESITRWAIHPGGKKILETIQQELDLQRDDLSASFNVLRNYGNMSSPTILFVLKEIMQQLNGKQEKIFAAAFGPGLTMETLILEQ